MQMGQRLLVPPVSQQLERLQVVVQMTLLLVMMLNLWALTMLAGQQAAPFALLGLGTGSTLPVQLQQAASKMTLMESVEPMVVLMLSPRTAPTPLVLLVQHLKVAAVMMLMGSEELVVSVRPKLPIVLTSKVMEAPKRVRLVAPAQHLKASLQVLIALLAMYFLLAYPL